MLNATLVGAIAMASSTVSLFFFGFWKSTKDRFFLYFAISFALEAANRLILGLSLMQNEDAPIYYVIRLIAYGLILYAIVEKNVKRDKE
ncbi:DUF5985 family protein [Noviherbaspirillum sp. ST9]|uniref:DUF5985 family protein n=1 Tax=Noviherbaspirillum sp. ST9 TaxID=3401606 RepID=UPI003B58ABE2